LRKRQLRKRLLQRRLQKRQPKRSKTGNRQFKASKRARLMAGLFCVCTRPTRVSDRRAPAAPIRLVEASRKIQSLAEASQTFPPLASVGVSRKTPFPGFGVALGIDPVSGAALRSLGKPARSWLLLGPGWMGKRSPAAQRADGQNGPGIIPRT
jgi:hypothetical protein